MSIALVFLCLMVLLTKRSAVSLSRVICVVPCGQPISWRVVLREHASRALSKQAAISASVTLLHTHLMMFASTSTAPLGSGGGLFVSWLLLSFSVTVLEFVKKK